jgi:hypothetical protein
MLRLMSFFAGAFLLGWGQQSLRMGAHLHLAQSWLLNATDRQAPPQVALRPTYRPGLSGFFIWGWSPYWGTGLEVAYLGAGQNYHGVGVNGQNYSAAIRQSYLRFATPIQFQYQWKTWGLWAHLGPTLAVLVQSDHVYQGDSLPSHNRYAPEIIQNTLNYLALSTDPEDQLILMRLYRRWNWGFVLAGGVKSRLAPGVWTLALIGYHRTFTDVEAKNFRLSPESPPAYHPERKPTYLQHLSLQLGLVYEIERTPAP